MKGFLSLVLVSTALLQMTAAAPIVSERSQAIKRREGEQNVEKRVWDWRFYMVTDNVDDAVLDNPEGYRSARTSRLSETAGSCLGRPSEDQVLQIIKAVMVQYILDTKVRQRFYLCIVVYYVGRGNAQRNSRSDCDYLLQCSAVTDGQEMKLTRPERAGKHMVQL
ncbi:hypothetical protein F4604DRAFT_1901254 [Suillus subluteus]|nr:hypothetical protein F4604DRAFT_1901254 [Suillus subluteus]